MSGLSLLALTYLSLLVFASGVILRALKYATAPMHLRWELYPVPHEKGKGEYGGSYFEEVDWWSKPRETSLVREILAMLEEMLLIRSLWHRNRTQWYASFPFHGGLYLLIGFTILLVFGALTEAAGIYAGWSPLLVGLTAALGVTGLVSATLGALSLLLRRLFNAKLRGSSTTSDYVNLLFALAVFLTAIFARLTADPSFAQLRAVLQAALTFDTTIQVPPAVATEAVVGALFLIYLPFTHMTHFVAKYFTYHQVRWDDAPNQGAPRMMARLQANLARPVRWSAPHIQGDDRSWAEAAMEMK